ncbi:MAG: DUF4198 domain-containing protein [Pseudomonadota bacterium]
MFRILSLVVAGLFAFGAEAHELWMDSPAFQITSDSPLEVDIRIGEAFNGARYGFLPREFRRFDVVHNGRIRPVPGRIGDIPAARFAPFGEGLHVLVYRTVDRMLTYHAWTKFVDFTDHKGFGHLQEAHEARGLPQTGFKEIYSRYAKTLIGVGEAEGKDAPIGLETEIVALANPYTDDLSSGFPVEVLYQGTPRADAQIELFEKTPDGTVEIALYRTDDMGRALLPVKAGHIYQVDAVVARMPSAELAARTGGVWETLWANLTFAVPED